MTDSDVIIVGGGISGLATAWWLQQSGVHTTVLEQSARAGGKIESENKAGYLMDHGATMVVNYRPEVCHFIKQSGLDNLKINRNALAEEKRYLLHRDRLITIPTQIGRILGCPAWSLRAKLRMAMEPLIKKGGHQDETAADFIRRRLGSEILDSAFEPYITGILANDPEKANAYTLLPRLTALEQNCGGILKGIINARIGRRPRTMASEVFSFQGGMTTLPQRLADILQFSAYGNLSTEHRVKQIEKTGKHWLISAQSPTGEKQFSACHIVLAAPAPVSSDLISPFDGQLAELLAGIEYAPLSIAHMGFDRSSVDHPLNGTGFLAPARERRNINGNLWISSIFPNRAPDNKVLLTSCLGGPRKPEAIDWSDEKVSERVIDDVSTLLNIHAAPEMLTIKRHQQALPLYHGNYYRRCQTIQHLLQNHLGLSLQANYLGGVSIRDCLANSKLTAVKIIKQLGVNNEVDSTEPEGYCGALSAN